MSIKKFFLFFFPFFILSLSFSQLTYTKALANTILLHDDFDDGDANGWEEHSGGGSWQIKQPANSNFVYEGKAVSPTEAPYTVNGETNWTDYIFEVDIRAIQGVNKPVLFRYRKLGEHYGIDLVSGWGANDPKNSNIINLHKSSTYALPNGLQDYYVTFYNYPNTWYRLKIIVVNINQNTTNIKVYVKDLDNSIDYGLVLEYSDDYYPITNGKIALLTWPGGYQGDGSPTTTQFDNIVVSSLTPPPTPTPSPTPIPPDPIILLPGLGASWNHEAMILNQPVSQTDWYMTPFVKSYDGLIQTLKNAGYEDTGDNKNLFIFNYDWRQPIETTANQLGDYVENTIDPPDGTEIDLVGHSLGGLVARTYVQNNSDHQIDQLITVGSPHKGTPKVYYLWEGADLNRALFPAWQRIGAGLLLQLYKRGFENNVETIHNVIPSLKDLLPTFPYLKQNGAERPLSEMDERNEWLETLNIPPLPEFLISVLNNILGLKGDTLRWINVVPRNSFDQLLGRWIDGKPIGEEFEMGDGMVLAESGQLEETSIVELADLDHGELVETVAGQQAIVELLNLSPSEVVSAPIVSYEPSLVFQLASPATITIFGPDGWQIGEEVDNNIPGGIYSPNDKLIIIPNPREGEYQAQVSEEGSGGDFRLLIGKLLSDFDIWQEFEGETSEEPQTFTTVFSEDPSQNKLELLKLAKQRLELVKEKILQLDCPFKRFLTSVIKWRIRQIEMAIRLLQRGREKWSQATIRETIFSLTYLEKNLKFWAKLCRFSPEFQQELLENIKIPKDYLLQAYELE